MLRHAARRQGLTHIHIWQVEAALRVELEQHIARWTRDTFLKEVEKIFENTTSSTSSAPTRAPTPAKEDAPTPRVIASLHGVRAIAAGDATSFAIDSVGAVFGWGNGEALGLEATEDQLVSRRFDSVVVQQA